MCPSCSSSTPASASRSSRPSWEQDRGGGHRGHLCRTPDVGPACRGATRPAPGLRIGDLVVEQHTAGVIDLGGGSDFAGILTPAVFEDRPLTIDPRSSNLTIGEPGGPVPEGVVVDLHVHRHGPAVDWSADLMLPSGRTVRVEVDTGSATLILDTAYLGDVGLDRDDPSLEVRTGTDETGHEWTRRWAQVDGSGAPGRCTRDCDGAAPGDGPGHRARRAGRHRLPRPLRDHLRPRPGSSRAIPVRVGRVSILDDARAGMDPDIRPQDDLFGHVNGRWLDETEIPSDRSSWGPFVQLADVAEAQVREIIEDLAARRPTAGDGRPSSTTTRARSATSSPPSWTRSGSSALGHPAGPAADRRGGRAARRPRPGGVPRRVRADRRPRALRLLRRHRRPRLRPLPLPHRPGRARPARRVLLPRRQVRRDPREVRRLPRRAAPRSADHDDPDGAARDGAANRHQAGRGSLGARRDPRRPEDLQPATPSPSCARCARPSTGTPTSRNLGASAFEADEPRRGLRAAAVLLSPTSPRCSTRCRSRTGGPGCSPTCCAPRRRTSPTTFVEANFDFYGRTLNGTPELRARWKRGVALVEGALGEAVGKEYVARHFPPPSKALMDDLVANLLEAYRPSISRLDWMTEETKAAGLREARHLPPQDRLPGEVPRLLRAARSAPTTCSATSRRPRRSRPTASSPRSARRSTATSGSCCRRPSTPTTTPAPTRSASRPASCRSRSSPRRRPGRELRRHRRGHRPRDRPRLRRPGRAVRRPRQPQRLVDRRRQGGVRGEVEGADRAVRRASSRAPCPASTSTARSPSARTSATSAA